MSWMSDHYETKSAVICMCTLQEYYLASACGELYAPPTASISLRGFAVGGVCVCVRVVLL